METIVKPTAAAMVSEGCPFTGVLFAGLMIDKRTGKAKLLEHNVRFGDPECQVLMTRLRTDLVQSLVAACDGRLGDVRLEFSPETAMVVVLAAQGYPGAYDKGSVIKGIDTAEADGAVVFHAGTGTNDAGETVATGGRVLGVTAMGGDVAEAQARVYAAVDNVEWPQGFCRRDIGWREVARLKDH